MTSPPRENELQPESHLFDTSAIPDTPECWEALSSRIQHTASIHRTRTWIASSRASRISVACLAIAAALVLLLSDRRAPSRQSTDGVLLALAPTDLVGRALGVRERPPSFVELLLSTAIDAERAK